MIELFRGDCLDVTKRLGRRKRRRVDVVITDPPYGLGLGVANDRRSDWQGRHLGKRAYASYEDSHENFVGLIVPRINAALSLATRGAVFTGPHIHDQAKPSAIGGIYHPAAFGRTSWGFKNFLPVLFYGKAPDLHYGHHPTVLRSAATAEKNGHPCPKPLEWMAWLIELGTRPGDTVYDPFMGSGITGAACKLAGRNFIGAEIDPEYFAIAERRIRAAAPAVAV